MDCDGGKKILIHDLDGTLMGDQPGVIFSKSEFAWGDATRGTSNGRIPPSMSRGVATGKNRGIVRSGDHCEKTKNFWKCSNIPESYGVLVRVENSIPWQQL